MYKEEYDQDVNIALSAQELIDCVGKDHGIENGCNGIPLAWGFDYVLENGIAYRYYYPHTNVYGECKVIPDNQKYHIAGYEKPEVYNKYGLFELLKKGPVAVTLGLDPEYFQFYQSDIKTGPYFNSGYYRPSVYGVLLESNQYKEDGLEEFAEWPYFSVETRLRACDSVVFRLPVLDRIDNANIGGIAGFAIRPLVNDPVPTSFTCNETLYPSIEAIPAYATELIFEENSYPNVQTLDFSRFTQLRTLIVKNSAFANCNSVYISNSYLKVIDIGDNCFTSIAPTEARRLAGFPDAFVIANAPNLSTITIGSGSLTNVSSIEIGNVSDSVDVSVGAGSYSNVENIIVDDSNASQDFGNSLASAIENSNPGKNVDVVIRPTEAPTTLLPTTLPPTTLPPTTLPPPTLPPTTLPPTTLPPTTLPPTTLPPTTLPPTIQPPIPTTPPQPWLPIYDPFILGDNCNYESQDTCIEMLKLDIDVLKEYLAIRDQYPTYALRHTRVLALMGMTETAVALFHESLSKQELNPNPIDCYFYSDYLQPRYVDANLAIPLVNLTRFTKPSRLVFSDGTFMREGMNAVIQWMVENREKGYFQNLTFFQITRHKTATFKEDSNGTALQSNIVANLKLMCQDTINFPVLQEMNFDANAYNEYNNGFDTALRTACDDVTIRKITLKASPKSDRPITMCRGVSTTLAPNYDYYNMTNPSEIAQCRYTWNWELFDEFSQYADDGPYPNENSVSCSETPIQPSCTTGYETVNIIRTTRSFASQERIKILDNDVRVFYQPVVYETRISTWSVSLCRRNHTLVMTDSAGNGWSAGSDVELKIGDYSLGEYRLSSGSSNSVVFTVVEPPTLPPTTQPPTTQPPTTFPPTTLPPTTQPPINCDSANELTISSDSDCERLFENGWKSITVNEGLCYSMTSNLTISDNPCLESIDIKKNSLKNLNSLVISNNAQLSNIVTEDGDGGNWDESKNTGVFYYVTSVEISSIF